MRGSGASSQPAASPKRQNSPGTWSQGCFAAPPQSPTSPSAPWGRTAQPQLLPLQPPKPGSCLHGSCPCKMNPGCHAKLGNSSRSPLLPPFPGRQPWCPRAKRMCESHARTSCRRASFPTAQMHLGAAGRQHSPQPLTPPPLRPLNQGGQIPPRGLGHRTEWGRQRWPPAQPRAAECFEGSFRLW